MRGRRAPRQAPVRPCTPRGQWEFMTLAELTVNQLRCIVERHHRRRVGAAHICGDNGSGQASLLEGIFLLGRSWWLGGCLISIGSKEPKEHLRVIGRVLSPS